jgi:hypothetical protein
MGVTSGSGAGAGGPQQEYPIVEVSLAFELICEFEVLLKSRFWKPESPCGFSDKLHASMSGTDYQLVTRASHAVALKRGNES